MDDNFLLGLGLGFTAFSLWGAVFGVVGTFLIPFCYYLIASRKK